MSTLVEAARAPLRIVPWAAFALALAYLAWVASMPLNHDTQWYLVSVARWLDGATMYRDILELNPPLAAILTVPPVALAEASDVDPAEIFVAYIGGLAALSLWLLSRLWRARGDLDGPQRQALLLTCLAATLLYPVPSFGQREQIALILMLPYLFLSGVPKAVPRLEAFGIGLLAGLGFSIKPYFLLVPLLIGIAQMVWNRRLAAAFTAENWGVAAAALAYAASVAIFFPLYLSEMVPLARLTYAAGWDQPLSTVLAVPELWYVLAAIVVTVQAARRRRAVDPTSTVLLLAAIALAIAFIWQHKGWFYQIIPVGGVLIVLAGWWIARPSEREGGHIAWSSPCWR